MARDLPETRGETSRVLPPANSTFRFDRLTATVQDMIVRTLEEVVLRDEIPSEVLSEMTIVQKFETAPGADEDVLETYTRLTHEWPHLTERLPAIGVLKPAGTTEKATIGLNFIATVQEPPAIEATNSEPYDLGIAVRERRRITITAAPLTTGTVLSVTVAGTSISYTTVAADTYATAAQELAHAIRLAVGYLVEVRVSDATIDLYRWIGGQAFTLVAVSGVSVSLVTAAAGGAEPAQLVVQTTPRTRDNPRRAPIASTLLFSGALLEEGEDPGALSAAAVVRMINDQALYVRAEVFDNAGTPAVRIVAGGRAGGKETPNEIEVLSDSSATVVSALGLGSSGDVDSLSADPDGVALAVTGGSFVAGDVGMYATVAASTNPLDNDGRFQVLDVPDADTLVLDSPYGVPETSSPATWFLGARSDWLDPTRPAKHRYGYRAQLTVPIAIMAESAVVRSELESLVQAKITHRAQEQLWELIGPGFLSSSDSSYDSLAKVQVILHGMSTSAAASATPRSPNDTLSSVHVSRLSVPMTVWVYVDRDVTAADDTRLDLQPGDVVYGAELPVGS